MPDFQTIFMGSDHAGFSLKETVKAHLLKQGMNIEDMGTYDNIGPYDYPDAAHKVCKAVLENGARGILICGTGIGMSIAANRHTGIRAAVCVHEFHARAARAHNNANVLCIGERVTAPGLALELTRIFLETEFEAGRHQRRIELIEKI